MSIENGKCPSCGGALLLDSSKEKAICKYCGHEVIIQQAVQKCVIDGIADFDTKLLSAQRAIEYDNDFDKAQKLYREALELRPDDYKALWGLYLSEMSSISYAKGFKGYVMQPGDIYSCVEEVTRKYGNRAYTNAPEEIKPYYYRIMQNNKSKFAQQPVYTKKRGCYVATCVYGSYDCPEVWVLRRYRDYTLGATWYGRLFIRFYYAISPTFVKCFGKKKWFKKMWQGQLDKIVKKLHSKGVANTPYNDKQW